MSEEKPFKLYRHMVLSLFKVMETLAATFLHAAVGIMGETAELFEELVNDFGNKVKIAEELGDIRFYLEYLLYALDIGPGYLIIRWKKVLADTEETPRRINADHCVNQLVIEAGFLLDYCKKAWVYNAPLNEEKMREHLNLFVDAYLRIIYAAGWDLEYIENTNQVKLAKRFPEGVYTDNHAQLRLDKADEEDANATGPRCMGTDCTSVAGLTPHSLQHLGFKAGGAEHEAALQSAEGEGMPPAAPHVVAELEERDHAPQA